MKLCWVIVGMLSIKKRLPHVNDMGHYGLNAAVVGYMDRMEHAKLNKMKEENG